MAAKEKKKKQEKKRSFVACVTASLRLVVFVLRLWGGKLVVLSCLYDVEPVFHLKK